jgi:hypothetical protein
MAKGPAAHTFEAVIREGRGGGAYVEIPFDVPAAFGEKQPTVKATIGGETFASRLVTMGMPCHLLGVPKELRVRQGKGVGDVVRVSVVADATPRAVVVPDDLAAVLSGDLAAKAFFDSLSYTHRKEYVRWVTEAKKPETRANRCAKTLEMLRAGKRGI